MRRINYSRPGLLLFSACVFASSPSVTSAMVLSAETTSAIAALSSGIGRSQKEANGDTAEAPLGQPLKLTFSNIEPETGTLWISVCTKEQLKARDAGEEFDCPGAAKIPAKEGAEITFDDIPAGTYAATAYHDDNDNGQLDFDDRGIPFEATGNARNARGFFGPPSFNQMKIKLAPVEDNASTLEFEVIMYKVKINF
ncbi:MAG: DUF2141 domain-containing protein [Pseudomonadota bacterium]